MISQKLRNPFIYIHVYICIYIYIVFLLKINSVLSDLEKITHFDTQSDRLIAWNLEETSRETSPPIPSGTYCNMTQYC